jgi:hypothetical protein
LGVRPNEGCDAAVADAVERVDIGRSNFQAGQRMKKPTIVIGAVLIAQHLGTPAAFAGPWEDGMADVPRTQRSA